MILLATVLVAICVLGLALGSMYFLNKSIDRAEP
jgi:hypothetical protein